MSESERRIEGLNANKKHCMEKEETDDRGDRNADSKKIVIQFVGIGTRSSYFFILRITKDIFVSKRIVFYSRLN